MTTTHMEGTALMEYDPATDPYLITFEAMRQARDAWIDALNANPNAIITPEWNAYMEARAAWLVHTCPETQAMARDMNMAGIRA